MSKEKEEKELKTHFSFNPIWKLLIDRNLKKRQLQK